MVLESELVFLISIFTDCPACTQVFQMWWHSLALCVYMYVFLIVLIQLTVLFYFVLQFLFCFFFVQFCTLDTHLLHLSFIYKESKFYQNQMYIYMAVHPEKMCKIQACTMSRLLHFYLPQCKCKCLCSVQNRMEVSTFF